MTFGKFLNVMISAGLKFVGNLFFHDIYFHLISIYFEKSQLDSILNQLSFFQNIILTIMIVNVNYSIANNFGKYED